MPRLRNRAQRRVLARTLESNRRLEAQYARALGRVMRALHADMVSTLAPSLPAVARKDSFVDSAVDIVLLHHVTAAPGQVGGIFDKHAQNVSAANAKALRVVGITPTQLGLADVFREKRADSISYIEKAQRAYADDVKKVFADPDVGGLRVEEIKERLLARADVSESRAELIARDQTLKLNGAIAQTRQENAGVERYVWSTSLDERVREEHAALEGQVFSWTDPPSVGHPGEDYQCRCVAVPVIDGLEDLGGVPVVPPDDEPTTLAPPEPVAAPAPDPQLEVGEQVSSLESEVSQAATRQLLQSIDDAPTTEFLAKNPIQKLTVKKQAAIGRDKVNGWYSPATRELHVTGRRPDWTFGMPFKPGETWSISAATKTPEDAAAATLRHEIGHHVHLVDGRGSHVDTLVQEAYVRAKAAGVAITEYAATKPVEYFAESFAAYHLRRADLAAHDPNGYAMVLDVLRARGC